MSRLRTCSCAALALALVLGACGDDDDSDDGGATGTAPPSSAPDTAPDTAEPPGTASVPTTGPPPTGAPTSEPAPPTSGPGPGVGGCVADAPDAPPPGAVTGEVPDVDGDGRPDTGWVGTDPDGGRSVGIVTAGGVGTEFELDSGSPIGASMLVADADATPPVEVFVSDGRTVHLLAFVDCALQPVVDPDGEPYLFDLGFRGTGTGVGCVEVDGRQELVGLLAGDPEGPDGEVVPWTRTVVELDGLTARNGASDSGTFTRPQDDEAIELLHTVSCGDRTIARDGIGPAPG